MNINAFSQVPVRGQLDLQISKTGVISARVGANQTANGLKAGDRVKFDTGTSGNIPQVVKAAYNENAIGTVIYDVKQSTYSAGDPVQIAILGGHVQYFVAGETITPGQSLDIASDGTVAVHAAGKVLGWALDGAAANGLLRVVLTLAN